MRKVRNQMNTASGSQEKDIQLEDGDYVLVPDSKLSRFSRIVDAFRSLFPGFTIT